MSIVIYRRTGTAKYNHEQTQHQQSQEIAHCMADIAPQSPLRDEDDKELSECGFENDMTLY